MNDKNKCEGCYYYYPEIGVCMYGEPDVTRDKSKKCEKEESQND